MGVRESAALSPSSRSIGASWSIRSTSTDGQREVWTSVDVSLAAMGQLENGGVADGTGAVWTSVEWSLAAMGQLENGVVADDTRLALRTQGRSAVEVAVKPGDH